MAAKIKYQDLLEIIEKETSFNKTKSDDFIKQIVEIIQEGLKRDGKVRISGFGTFNLRHVNERQGINPQTGETITIPEHTKVVFKGAKNLRDKVNHRYNLLQAQSIADDQQTKINKTDEPVQKQEVEKPGTKDDSERKDILGKLSEFEQIPEEKPVQKRKDLTPTGVQMAPVKPEEKKEKVEKPEPVKEKSPIAEKKDFEKGAPFDADDVQVIVEKEPEPEQNEKPLKKEEKKSKLGYILAALLLVVLLLIFIFWPASEEQGEQIAEAPVVQEQAKIKETPKPVVRLKKPGTPGGKHKIKNGDKLWGLSDSFYKDAYLWPNIYRMNYTDIPNPDILKLDKTLIVPSLEGTYLKLSAKDSADISLGFYHAYQAYKNNGNQWAKYYLWLCKKYDIKTFREKLNDVEKEDAQFALKRK